MSGYPARVVRGDASASPPAASPVPPAAGVRSGPALMPVHVEPSPAERARRYMGLPATVRAKYEAQEARARMLGAALSAAWQRVTEERRLRDGARRRLEELEVAARGGLKAEPSRLEGVKAELRHATEQVARAERDHDELRVRFERANRLYGACAKHLELEVRL